MGEVSQCFHFFCITFFLHLQQYICISSVQFKKGMLSVASLPSWIKISGYEPRESDTTEQLSTHTHINTTVVLWGLERSHLLNFQSWAESSKVSWNPNVRFCLIATTGFQDSLPCSCTELSQGLAQRGIKSDLEFVSDLSTLPVMRNWAACWIYSFF